MKRPSLNWESSIRFCRSRDISGVFKSLSSPCCWYCWRWCCFNKAVVCLELPVLLFNVVRLLLLLLLLFMMTVFLTSLLFTELSCVCC